MDRFAIRAAGETFCKERVSCLFQVAQAQAAVRLTFRAALDRVAAPPSFMDVPAFGWAACTAAFSFCQKAGRGLQRSAEDSEGCPVVWIEPGFMCSPLGIYHCIQWR